MAKMLEEVKVDYEKNLRAGTVDMMIQRPSKSKDLPSGTEDGKDYQAPPPAPTM